jgi:propionyl-CoA carboxylase alpha chain
MRKVLIVNRGEIVVRIARTCRAMGIATVAVFSDPDADAVHVAACDEAVAIGGDSPATSYLRQDALLEAAARTGADAVHPGFGFLAENAPFAQAVIDAGLTWIGPTPDAIAAMGDKVEAKRRMADAGVPLLRSAEVEGDDESALRDAADTVGYPLMVKAAAGGGGKGMRVVDAPADLVDAVAAARREAGSAFGDDRVFLERYVARARHVEVQVVGDNHGNVVHLFDRECSIQRRHQKVVEESPAPGLSDAQRSALWQAAVDAARAVGYVNAGTVEFVLDDDTGEFAFLEMNTRLQVEHPVTEEVTGEDLVRWQLLVAQGDPLPRGQETITAHGHAIEVRLYAEDPAHQYLPATGTLTGFRPAPVPALRWESGVVEGSVVSPFYDPMLAKVIAHAPTRREAATALATGLERTIVQGVVTNRDLLVQVLRHPGFVDGTPTTSFLAEQYPSDADRRFPPSDDVADLAVIVALLVEQADGTQDGHVPSTVPSGFTNTGLGPMPVEILVGGAQRTATVEADRIGWRIDPGSGTAVHARMVARDGDRVRVDVGGHQVHARVHVDGSSVQVALPGDNVTLIRAPRFPHRTLDAEPGAALSPMPGTVVSVAVAEGDRVAVGDLLAVVEAMKMEHRIACDVDGVVASVRVEAGTQVEADDVLVLVEPDGQSD